MVRLPTRCSLVALFLCSALIVTPLWAAIVPTGNVEPAINLWFGKTYGYIGRTSSGSVFVDGGSILSSGVGHLGYDAGITGTAIVTGAGSKWTSGPLQVGYYGSGMLSIDAGGEVSNTNGYLGTVQGSEGTVTVTGTGSTWTNGQLYVGESGTGSITVDAGGQVSSTAGVLGRYGYSTGTVKVTGVGSAWTNALELYVGRDGKGSLTIEAGGQVRNTWARLGYDSTAKVTGAGSQWINSGELTVVGRGSLAIEAGGRVANTDAYLGYDSGAMATATVSGISSTWANSGVLYVSSGNLTVADEGRVTAGELFASLDDLSGNGTITASRGGVLDADLVFDSSRGTQQNFSFGSGGTLDIDWSGGALGAGYKQNGSLTVADGVEISSTYGYLAYLSGATATAKVTGTNTVWTNHRQLYVGRGGNGTLLIEAGAQVNSYGNAPNSPASSYLGLDRGSTGTVAVTGAGTEWINSDSLYVGINGHGSLTIEAGGYVRNYDGRLGGASGSTGEARVTGVGSTWTNRGWLRVGSSGTGKLSITDGGLVTVGAFLAVAWDGGGDGVISMATGGMLALRGSGGDSLNQFLDLAYGTDAIRYWDASLEDWSLLTNAAYRDDYTLEYLTTGDFAGYTLLTVGRVGDFDNDGDVDGRDFLAWQRHPELGSLADWQNAYGADSPTAEAISLVPEPGGLAMMLGVLAMVRGARR